jgi:hypothetical protein
MTTPDTPAPPAPIYRVSINGEEFLEFQSLTKAAKRVADNVYTGRVAEVRFENVVDGDIPKTIGEFEKHMDGWLRQVDHTGPVERFKVEHGWEYSLPK